MWRKCSQTFDAVSIIPSISGGTVVSWKLAKSIVPISPFTFTLQFGHSPTAADEEWTDIVTTEANYGIDTVQRRFGQSVYSYYRVKLSEDNNTLITYSDAYQPCGQWSFREWAQFRAIGRSERRRMIARTGTNGILYKRRVYGTTCPRCTDYQTGVVGDGQCPTCLGTGFVGGYYDPQSCVWSEITQQSTRESLDFNGRATVNDQVIKGRVFAEYSLNTNDIWISKTTSERYAVQNVTNMEELRGIPIIQLAELRLIPPTDICYKLPLSLKEFQSCKLNAPCNITNLNESEVLNVRQSSSSPETSSSSSSTEIETFFY